MPHRNPVGWFEIYVASTERARAFYEAVFRIKLEKMPISGDSLEDMWAFPMLPDGGGATGAIVKMQGAPTGPGGTIVYFNCEDCAVEAARAVDAGGHLIRSKFSIGNYGAIALVSDLDGNIIGLHSRD